MNSNQLPYFQLIFANKEVYSSIEISKQNWYFFEGDLKNYINQNRNLHLMYRLDMLSTLINFMFSIKNIEFTDILDFFNQPNICEFFESDLIIKKLFSIFDKDIITNYSSLILSACLRNLNNLIDAIIDYFFIDSTKCENLLKDIIERSCYELSFDLIKKIICRIKIHRVDYVFFKEYMVFKKFDNNFVASLSFVYLKYSAESTIPVDKIKYIMAKYENINDVSLQEKCIKEMHQFCPLNTNALYLSPMLDLTIFTNTEENYEKIKEYINGTCCKYEMFFQFFSCQDTLMANNVIYLLLLIMSDITNNEKKIMILRLFINSLNEYSIVIFFNQVVEIIFWLDSHNLFEKEKEEIISAYKLYLEKIEELNEIKIDIILKLNKYSSPSLQKLYQIISNSHKISKKQIQINNSYMYIGVPKIDQNNILTYNPLKIVQTNNLFKIEDRLRLAICFKEKNLVKIYSFPKIVNIIINK